MAWMLGAMVWMLGAMVWMVGALVWMVGALVWMSSASSSPTRHGVDVRGYGVDVRAYDVDVIGNTPCAQPPLRTRWKYCAQQYRATHLARSCSCARAGSTARGSIGSRRGYSVDVRGYSVDVRGCSADVRGYAVDVRGYHVDVIGNAPCAQPPLRTRWKYCARQYRVQKATYLARSRPCARAGSTARGSIGS
eukprot:1196111-Prorocentrum_minimum.AAC.10